MSLQMDFLAEGFVTQGTDKLFELFMELLDMRSHVSCVGERFTTNRARYVL